MNIPICKILHGSHLYGLNTPESDTDYKGVFLPSLKDLVLKKDAKHISKNSNNSDLRNTSKDVDFESFSLHSFLDLVTTGSPMALEMLFAPRSMILESSSYWDSLRDIRKNLVTSNSKAFVGYCKGQASKYCIKGERLEALERCLEALQLYDKELILKDFFAFFCRDMLGCKYFEVLPPEIGHGNSFLIGNKKFYETAKIVTITDSLKHSISKYGERSKTTLKMDGKDWKALSHAVRISWEVYELLTSGTITLPLPEYYRELILSIKQGKVPLEQVENLLTVLLNDVDEAQSKSKLPKELNRGVIDTLILGAYKVEFDGDNEYFIKHWND